MPSVECFYRSSAREIQGRPGGCLSHKSVLSCILTIVAEWTGYTKPVCQAASSEAWANWKVKHANLLASMYSDSPVLAVGDQAVPLVM